MKNIFYFALAILVALASSLPVLAGSTFTCADVTEIPQIECEALVALYNSTNGPGWANSTNWLVTTTPRDWYGVTVTRGYVTSLFLSANLLQGSLPPELGNLTNLTDLHMWSNQLSDSIPSELGNLTNLLYLDLWENQLSGSLPPELGNLTKLSDLNLSENRLSGSLPPELSNLTNLIWMYLAWNQLSGSIPPELSNLTNLKVLALDSNQLSGSIPPELCKLTNLAILDLPENHLSGNIPPELGELTSLVQLQLGSNQLSGGIPPELGNLTLMAYLNLSGNQLSGSIPPELSDLTDLRVLDLSYNHLIGSIPSWLGNLTNPVFLSLGGNQLSGTIPLELSILTGLERLDLSNNLLSGSIPPELGKLTLLQILWLQGNLLEGDIPSNFTDLVNLYDPGQYYPGYDGLDLDSNLLNVPPGYPDPNNPLHVFLHQKDPDWQFYQGFQQVIGAGGGALTSLDGRTDFLFPAGALITDTTFTFMPQPAPHHAHPGLGFAHDSFALTAEDAFGNPVTAFNLPVTVTLTYTDADFGGMPEASLGLYYWDGAASAWTDAVTTCPGNYTRDPVGNLLALPLCHLTEFGVFGTPMRVFLPGVHH
jgi:Leucine-rich repeat (LRR) protein